MRTVSEKEVPVKSLSGGNNKRPLLPVVKHFRFPLQLATQGLDVGTDQIYHGTLIAERDDQKAVLLMSFPLDRDSQCIDRNYYLCTTAISYIPASETNRQEISLMMAGTSYEEVLIVKQEVALIMKDSFTCRFCSLLHLLIGIIVGLDCGSSVMMRLKVMRPSSMGSG